MYSFQKEKNIMQAFISVFFPPLQTMYHCDCAIQIKMSGKANASKKKSQRVKRNVKQRADKEDEEVDSPENGVFKYQILSLRSLGLEISTPFKGLKVSCTTNCNLCHIFQCILYYLYCTFFLPTGGYSIYIHGICVTKPSFYVLFVCLQVGNRAKRNRSHAGHLSSKGIVLYVLFKEPSTGFHEKCFSILIMSSEIVKGRHKKPHPQYLVLIANIQRFACHITRNQETNYYPPL